MYVTLNPRQFFEHQHAHLQEDKFYYNSIWYRHSLYSTVQYSRLHRMTIPDANTICPPEDEHVNAGNMSRIVM